MWRGGLRHTWRPSRAAELYRGRKISPDCAPGEDLFPKLHLMHPRSYDYLMKSARRLLLPRPEAAISDLSPAESCLPLWQPTGLPARGTKTLRSPWCLRWAPPWEKTF